MAMNLAAILRAHGLTHLSHLEYLPSSAGHDPMLDIAGKCVAEALRNMAPRVAASPDGVIDCNFTQTQKTMSLYSVALRRLQSCLDEPSRSHSVAILSATVLLVYFEVRTYHIPQLDRRLFVNPLIDVYLISQALCGSAGPGIISHACGASKLIQHRGTERFSTEFEKSLLATQFPTMVRREEEEEENE